MSTCNLRRDQMWFIEKNHKGASELTSLAEYKVRKDVSYTKDYLKGRYGAIPYLEIQDTFKKALKD